MRFLLVSLGVFAVSLAILRCGIFDGQALMLVRTYVSASNAGDVVQWTFDTTKSTPVLNAIWQRVTSTGTTQGYSRFAAQCGGVDLVYGHRVCTVNSVEVTGSATASPSINSQYQWLELAGVGAIIHPIDSNARREGAVDEIHWAIPGTSCRSASGRDYAFFQMNADSGTPKASIEIHRFDSLFSRVTPAVFALSQSSSTFNMALDSSASSDDTMTSDSLPLCTGGCCNGIRYYKYGSNSTSMRAAWGAGMMWIDKPYQQGYKAGIDVSRGATIDQVAGKTYVGSVFGEGVNCSAAAGCGRLAQITLSSVSNGTFTISSSSMEDGASAPSSFGFTFRAASSAPAGTRFNSVSSANYGSHALSSTYPAPSAIPGLFYDDNNNSPYERPTLLLASRTEGKIVLIGARTTEATSYDLIGHWIFIEK